MTTILTPLPNAETGKRPADSHLRPTRPNNVLGHILLIALSALALLPIYWMFMTALKPANEIYSSLPYPVSPTLENFAYVAEELPILRILGNTFVTATVQTVAQLFTALLAAYAFARWTFPGRNLLLLMFTLTWLVPFQAIMIPNYVLISQLKWLDSLPGLIVPNLASTFAVLLLFQTIKGFPLELIDAARSDGATNWGVLWRIIVPNLGAALAALAILLFISAWNEYFWPVMINRKLENSVIQIAIQMFRTQEGDNWGALMAASSIASLPILVVYILLQRQIIDSFLKSGLRS